MMFPWYIWLGLGMILLVFSTFFTYIWWKIGDQWADAEYKKFGHGGGGPVDTSKATVISDLNSGLDMQSEPVVIEDLDGGDDRDGKSSSAEKTG